MAPLVSRPCRFSAKFLVLLFFVTFGACDCETGIQGVSPHLGPSDDSIDFGQVAVGDSAVQTLRLAALTSADVEITVTLDVNDAGAFSFPTAAPEVVSGNGFVDVKLSFEPAEATVYAATLDIVSNDPEVGRARRRVLLSGEGKRAELTVSPEALELSAIACPASATSELCSDEGRVVLKNTGLVNLNLGQIEISKKDSGEVVPNLTLAKAVTTTRLRPGETLEVPVRWKPAPAQAQTDSQDRYEMVLRIPSNNASRPVWDVPIFAHADENEPPKACVNVVGVTRREYEYQAGQLKMVTKAVEPVLADGVLQVRPGCAVTVSASSDTGIPCTFDPEGEAVASQWSVNRPEKSRTDMTPKTTVESAFEVDAAGEYEVKLVVSDGLGQTGQATLAVNAEPRDDLFVQLSWETDELVDFDLHLLVDAGPLTLDGLTTSYSQASLFCDQDTFFANPNPNLFDEDKVEDNPRLLRDDQGSAGRLESISLEEVPDGSRFRVAVHYFDGVGAATPTLSIRLRGASAPISLTGAAMATKNGTWFGAEIDFPAGAQPEVLPIDDRTSGDVFAGVGVCN